MTKKLVKITGLMLLTGLLIGGCGKQKAETEEKTENGKITVLSTGFAGYDFAKEIGGDKVDSELLMPPGVECHGYEPAPKDIKRIEKADIFVYTGGESESWIKEILKTTKRENKENVSLMDVSDTLSEDDDDHAHHDDHEDEEHEDHDHEDHAHHHGHADEHVWLSIENAEKIVEAISKALVETDPKNAEYYEKNTEAYLKKLEKLDSEYEEIVKSAKRDTVAVGDRFPYRYLLEPMGIKYISAIPRCAGEAEPNAAKVAELTDFIKENHIPVVFHAEMGESRVCDSIAEATGAKSETLYALHNVTPEDHKKGTTYLEFMEHNLKVLKEALN